MNGPQKRTAAETWAAIQAMGEDDAADLEADEAANREADRIMTLSPEELRRELVEAGFDPDEVRARAAQLTEEVLRSVEERSAASPAAAPLVAEPLVAKPLVAKPLVAEPLVAEPLGSDPVVQAAATAPIPLRPVAKAGAARGPSRVRTVVALLAAAFVIVLAVSWHPAGEAIARWIYPPDPTILPDKPSPSMVSEAYAKKRAKDLRAAAHGECANSQWETCAHDLDEAATLDPAGNDDETVRRDRAAAHDALMLRLSPPISPKPGQQKP